MLRRSRCVLIFHTLKLSVAHGLSCNPCIVSTFSSSSIDVLRFFASKSKEEKVLDRGQNGCHHNNFVVEKEEKSEHMQTFRASTHIFSP